MKIAQDIPRGSHLPSHIWQGLSWRVILDVIDVLYPSVAGEAKFDDGLSAVSKYVDLFATNIPTISRDDWLFLSAAVYQCLRCVCTCLNLACILLVVANYSYSNSQ